MSLQAAKRRKLSSAGEQPSIKDDQSRNLNEWSTSNDQSDERQSKLRSRSLLHRKSSSQRSKLADQSSAEFALACGRYKSSLFKLQIDELLTELRPDHEKQLARAEQS